jgi:hypothetical protein
MMRALRALVLVLVVAIPLVAAGQASPAANEHASCKGILVSSLAGEPGEVAEATHFVHEIVKGLGLPPGVHVSAAAGHLHEEDVAACLEALGF